MITRKVRGQPRIAHEDLVNDLKRGGTAVSKVRISYILCSHGLKSCSTRKAPPAQASTCPGPSEFASDHLNDPEEALEKIMWSDETKIKLFGLNSTRCVKKDEIQSHLNCEAWGGIMPWWCFSCCKEDWMAAPHLREDR